MIGELEVSMDLGQLRGLVTEGANLKVGSGVGEREWGRKIMDFAFLVSREGKRPTFRRLPESIAGEARQAHPVT